jgi:hypothetical protein
VGAFQAAIVMTWNLTFWHLCTFVLKHHLAAFNTRYPVSLPNKHVKAKVQTIAKYEDFLLELKESEVLTICRDAKIIDPNIYKILDAKLDRRNSAAHPSVKIDQLQAEEYVDDLVKNVVLKLVIDARCLRRCLLRGPTRETHGGSCPWAFFVVASRTDP